MSNLFDFNYIDNNADSTLFLLHGTGGTKNDFLFLNERLQTKYNLVGLQGNIDEHGSSRFFKRLAEGVFDHASIKAEVSKLKQFLGQWRKEKLDQPFVFLGYSNGANMILATMLLYPELIKNAALLHPMMPFVIENASLDLSKHSLFVSTGSQDPMVSQSKNHQLLAVLDSCRARLTTKEYPGGHQISNQEINDTTQFLLNL